MSDFIKNSLRNRSSGKALPLYMRRQHARSYRKAPISFSLFKDTETRNAIMYNEGIGGMYFETDAPLTPGTIIRIQLLESSPLDAPPETTLPPSFHTAEVRWCREITKNPPDKRFGIGVHYHQATIQ